MAFPNSLLLTLWFQKALFIKNKLKEQEKKKRKAERKLREGNLLLSYSWAEVFPGQPSLSIIHPSLPKINTSLEQNPLENKVHLELKNFWKKGTFFPLFFLTKNIL